MSEQDRKPPHEVGIVYHAQDHGKPCLGCFIGAMFDAMKDEDLSSIPLDPEDVEDEDPQDVDFARTLGATFAEVADQMAALAVQLCGPDAGTLMEPFHERLDNMIQLHNAQETGHAH